MPYNYFYTCEYCKYKTEERCDFYKHLNAKEHIDNQFVKKKKNVAYICKCCDFGTLNKYRYTHHLTTKYHATVLEKSLNLLQNVESKIFKKTIN